nr:16S rRNA (cytosine(967)-C(5))-methyltransferase RsmB [Clostridium thermarum]
MMNVREIAVMALEMVLVDGAYSNIVLRRLLNQYNVEEKDRALITEIVYGTLKYKYKLDVILSGLVKSPLKKLDNRVLNILRMSLYQFIYLDKVPEYAIVNEAVNLAKKTSIGASKFVNGVLRGYLRNKERNYNPESGTISELAYKYSFEKWMVKLFVKQYGEERAKQILAGLNSTPSVTVRINSMRFDYDEVWDELTKLNYNIEEGAVCPEAIKILKGSNIENNPLFKEGYFTVQDESAMMATLALAVMEHNFVMDMCAAPGGKSTHIGELLRGTGRVEAFDLYDHKIKLIMDNAKRLHIENISAKVMDASVYNEEFDESYHRVLVDVPCSGIGIIRKKPEIKWTKTMKEIEGLYSMQDKILNNASRYVKKGGILVYSTCTLNRAENEERIYSFLEKNNDFTLETLNFGQRTNFIYSADGMLTILPDKDMDGFFIAKLKKKL